MVITMAGQLKQLMYMAVFGFCAAFIYDILRAARRITAQNTFSVSVQDIIFWLFLGVSTFLLIFRLNYGEIRLFMFLGMVIGMAVYFTVISPVFLKITAYIVKGVGYVIRIVIYPFSVTADVLKTIFEYFVNFIKKDLKKSLFYGKILKEYLYKNINIIFKKH